MLLLRHNFADHDHLADSLLPLIQYLKNAEEDSAPLKNQDYHEYMSLCDCHCCLCARPDLLNSKPQQLFSCSETQNIATTTKSKRTAQQHQAIHFSLQASCLSIVSTLAGIAVGEAVPWASTPAKLSRPKGGTGAGTNPTRSSWILPSSHSLQHGNLFPGVLIFVHVVSVRDIGGIDGLQLNFPNRRVEWRLPVLFPGLVVDFQDKLFWTEGIYQRALEILILEKNHAR